jgi:gamma-glutamylcysteine synthetase
MASRHKPKPADPPPEMVQQIQQMNTVIEKMTAELDQAKAALQGKQVESQAAIQIAQMSNESRERIAQLTADHALAKIHGQLAQKEMDLSDDVAIQVAGIETISREKVAQLNAATELAKTTQKIDGAIDLAAVKAQLDALAARLELATAGTTPSDKAGS